MRRILVLPQIRVHNANALSSPYTIGFPAMTGWLGAVHALQRRLNQGGLDDLKFTSTAIACHDFNLQTYKGRGDFVNSIIGTGNPLVPDKRASDKWNAPFTRPAFIETARCHLTASLAIEYEGISQKDENDGNDENHKGDESKIIKKISDALHTKKIAGGDIINFGKPFFLEISTDDDFKYLIRRLMPGYMIVERRDLVEAAMKEENGKDALTTLIDFLQVTHNSVKDEKDNIIWETTRKGLGWIVPIATGFHAITALHQAEKQRDPKVLHRFAESIITLGEFVMPYRIKNLDEMLWHYHTDLENNLYACQQNTRKSNYKEIQNG